MTLSHLSKLSVRVFIGLYLKLSSVFLLWFDAFIPIVWVIGEINWPLGDKALKRGSNNTNVQF